VNYYQHHIGDFLRKTLGISMLREGAYRRAMDLYYAEERPLPLKPDVYDSLRCLNKADRDAVDYVLGRYFRETPEGYRHERCDEELAKYAAKSAKAAASADARWAKQAHSEGNANAMRTHSEGNASQKPVTKNQEPGKNKSTRVPREVASLPPWLPPEDWARWAQHRGKKLTAAAVPLQIRKLDGLRAEGHDPVALIDLAIESGWATFWPPKDAPRGRHASLTAVGSRTAENLRRFADDEEMPNGTHGP